MSKDIIQAKTLRTFQAARLNPCWDVSRKLPSGSLLQMRYGHGELTLALRRVDTCPPESEWQAVTAALPLAGEISAHQGETDKGYFLYARNISVREQAQPIPQPIMR